MKRKLAIAAASACLLAASTVQANLVINGDFETGALPPWTQGSPTATIVGSGLQHAGNYAVQLQDSGAILLWQVLSPIVDGKLYTIDFWAKPTSSGFLNVSLDNSIQIISIPAAADWTRYTFDLTDKGGVGMFMFAWMAASGPLYIDDVSVVPEPATVVAGALLLLPLGVSTMRMLRRRMTA